METDCELFSTSIQYGSYMLLYVYVQKWDHYVVGLQTEVMNKTSDLHCSKNHIRVSVIIVVFADNVRCQLHKILTRYIYYLSHFFDSLRG